MKLKFLENINEYDEHAIRLNDFDKSQACQFLALLNGLIQGNTKSVDLADYEFIERVNCELLLRLSETDEGITTEDFIHFACDLTLESYKAIAKQIAPYCEKKLKSYSILYELDNPIEFIFSGGIEDLTEPE